MPPDTLESARQTVVGIDLIAAAIGRFIRGQSTPTPTTLTASGVTTGVEISGSGQLRLDLIVTAATGTTPSMTVTLQTSFDNGVTDAWRSLPANSAFAAVTAAGTTRQSFGGFDRWVRASIAITGTTPSLTFSLSGECV